MRPEIVAELSCNHGGSYQQAQLLVQAAANAGADAVKVQCWDPKRMVLDPAYTLKDGPWKGMKLKDLYDEAHTPWAWIPGLQELAHALNLKFIASVFDTSALAWCIGHKVQRYKIASFELVDTPLIAAVAGTGKPIIMSTGMADSREIANAIYVAGSSGARDITILHCVSAYPALPATFDLQRISHWARIFPDCKVGLSDHSTGTAVAVAATVFGATMIEKHFILDRRDGGPDAAFSLEPDELRRLRQDTEAAYQACIPHTERTVCKEIEEDPQRKLRRSLYWARDLEQGHIVRDDDVITARPALGLPPSEKRHIVGRTLTGPVKRGQPITE
jgi:pseudaminic acid synthase